MPSGVPTERVQLSVGVGSTRYVPVEVADDGSFGLHGLEEGLETAKTYRMPLMVLFSNPPDG